MARGSDNKYSVDDIVDAITECHGLLTVAAEKVGCNRVTLLRRAKTSKKIRDAIELARDKMGDNAEGRLFTAINRDERWAIELYLKTQCRDRGYFEKQLLEHTGEQSVTVDQKLPDFSNWPSEAIEEYNGAINKALTYVEKYKSTVGKDVQK